MTNLNIVKTNNTQDALLDAIAKEHLHIDIRNPIHEFSRLS